MWSKTFQAILGLTQFWQCFRETLNSTKILSDYSMNIKYEVMESEWIGSTKDKTPVDVSSLADSHYIDNKNKWEIVHKRHFHKNCPISKRCVLAVTSCNLIIKPILIHKELTPIILTFPNHPSWLAFPIINYNSPPQTMSCIA